MRTTLVVLSLVLVQTAFAQGRIGVTAGAQLFNGNLHDGNIAPSLSVHYETVGALESFGFRFEGHLNPLGGLLGGGLFCGTEYKLAGQPDGLHLSLFGGLEGDIHMFSFEPADSGSKIPVRFVMDIGPLAGLQIGYRGRQRLGVVLTIAGFIGYRAFLDGEVDSETSVAWSAIATGGILF